MRIANRWNSLDKNSKIVATNTIYAFIFKGAALAVSFLSTPAFIRYFGDNTILGLWYTLMSVLSWFLTFDLGIGNGLRNQLVKALSSSNRTEIKNIISSGFASVAVVASAIGFVGIILIRNLDLNHIFHISESLISSRALYLSCVIVFCAIVMRFATTAISSIFYSLQKAAINNLIALITSLLQLAYLLIFRFNDIEEALINVSIAFLIISISPQLIAAIIVFCTELRDCKPHYNHIRLNSIKQIMGMGGVFFICQISYMVIANTNEFFISYFWDPLYTADYTFYFKVSMLLSMMASLALTPLWSMITKAYEEQDFHWLTNVYHKLKISGFIIIGLQFSLIPFLQSIMNIWLGRGELDVSYPTAFAFACFGSSFIYSTMMSTIVCGLSKMKLQLYCYGIGAVLKIAFIILISHIIDSWVIIIWLNTIILTTYSIFEHIHIKKIFSKFSIA